MVGRIQKLNKTNSLFLFGARGCGKSTLLKDLFTEQDTLWLDLLRADDEDTFRRDPDQLSHLIDAHRLKPLRRVIIDEIQKIPKLLDIVHLEIEKNPNIQFVLTGSSARKLRRGAANLLAGRAFEYHLFPFTTFELGSQFDLEQVLRFGSLPKLIHLKSDDEKAEYLRTYARTYLREEILQEQIIRNIEPFQNFLEVAAQSNGKILSFSKISRDIGIDDKTVRNYFSILEDTYLGFLLEPFHRSIRKRQREAPKFYFFDLGVKRALDRTLRLGVEPGTYAYGEAFESWIIQECVRLNEYGKCDFRFSYLRTQADVEVDLIVARPGSPDLLVEIKSNTLIREDDTRSITRIAEDWDRPVEAQVWSLDSREKMIGSITCLPWQAGLSRLFGYAL
ncbi:MAG: AAA family ATPase [Bdellovibrionaceae bacterium]|nr:AAA family ATPase [Pseudobdellovibrionaceae bacterium]